jgi:predicted metal-dependent peptidase
MTKENTPSSPVEIFYTMSTLSDALADLSMAVRKLCAGSKNDAEVDRAVADIYNICSSIENIEATLMINTQKDMLK